MQALKALPSCPLPHSSKLCPMSYFQCVFCTPFLHLHRSLVRGAEGFVHHSRLLYYFLSKELKVINSSVAWRGGRSPKLDLSVFVKARMQLCAESLSLYLGRSIYVRPLLNSILALFLHHPPPSPSSNPQFSAPSPPPHVNFPSSFCFVLNFISVSSAGGERSLCNRDYAPPRGETEVGK